MSGSEKLTKLRLVINENLRVQRGGADPVPYIDVGNVLNDIRARQNHVVFARRGCGKTLLLHHSSRQLDTSIKSVYLNCEDFKRHSFPNVLIEILDALFGELEQHLTGWFGKRRRSRTLIAEIRKELGTLRTRADTQEQSIRESIASEKGASLKRAPRSVHTEHRVVSSATEPMSQGELASAQVSIPAVQATSFGSASGDLHSAQPQLHPLTDKGDLPDGKQVFIPSITSRLSDLPITDYSEYSGPPGNDPRSVDMIVVSEGIVRIVEVEGPVIAKRVYDIYLRSCGIQRMGHELKSTMNKALAHAIRQDRLESEDEANHGGLLFSVVRVKGRPPINLRSGGRRSFDEIPPSELQVVAVFLAERHGFSSGSDEHLRAVLERFDLKRLTTQVSTTLLKILERRFPYVDEIINKIPK